MLHCFETTTESSSSGSENDEDQREGEEDAEMKSGVAQSSLHEPFEKNGFEEDGTSVGPS